MKKSIALKKTLAPKAAPAAPRLLAALGLAALLGGVGLAASTRPARSSGGPVAVQVANTPLPTVPTDLAGPTQPFQHTFQVQTDSDARADESVTVPLHRRLVIEYVSANLNEYGSGGGYVILSTYAGGESVTYYLTDTVTDFNKRSQSVRIYADPGTTVTVEAVSADGSPGIGTDTEVSGYYVNVP